MPCILEYVHKNLETAEDYLEFECRMSTLTLICGRNSSHEGGGNEINSYLSERRIHLPGIEALILCLQFCKLWQYMPDLVEDILGLQEQDHRIATQERRTHRCK